MLDIPKAFNKVNHYCMFIKLMNRSVPVVLLKVLIKETWGKMTNGAR